MQALALYSIRWYSHPGLLSVYLRAKFVRNTEGERSFACARRASEEKSTTGHLFGANEVYHDATCLQETTGTHWRFCSAKLVDISNSMFHLEQ